MREQPKGDALLTCVRQVLKEEILPALPADKKHALLMVMNAISIAERQLNFGDAPASVELASLRTLLGETDVDLAGGSRRLAGLLRGDAADPGQPARRAYFAFLRATVQHRLRESNPKALPRQVA